MGFTLGSKQAYTLLQRHRAALRTAFLTLLACSMVPTPGHSQTTRDSTLIRLSEDIFRAQIVDNDTLLFARYAAEEFRVLAPGGMIEDRDQTIAGVRSWNATGIKVSGAQVIRRGPVALVYGRIDIDGEMRPIGRWGPLKFMTVFVLEADEWRLLSRSMTPCAEMLIQVGRC